MKNFTYKKDLALQVKAQEKKIKRLESENTALKSDLEWIKGWADVAGEERDKLKEEYLDQQELIKNYSKAVKTNLVLGFIILAIGIYSIIN